LATSPAELAIIRRAYAMQIMAAAMAENHRIEDAFASVPRETFLGPGPWLKFRLQHGYVPTPSDDPVYLYTDSVVNISPDRHINNGQPSLHAHLMSHAAPAAGEHVVHVGIGTGYYTALFAHLVGPSGSVTGIEFENDLAVRARTSLSSYPNVTVIEGDGSAAAFDPADVIYINAGATRSAETWLDGLKDNGRLILPLTTDKGFSRQPADKAFKVTEFADVIRRGAVFLIKRQNADFLARWISPVAIYPCQGMRDTASEQALVAAFEKDDWGKVTRLYRCDMPAERCWLRAPGWCLAYE
jgi:protein-L-isoaspartate(D-aspartate) O-methyltransferase